MKNAAIGLLLASSIAFPLQAFAQFSDPNANRIFAQKSAERTPAITTGKSVHFNGVSEAIISLNHKRPQSELWGWEGASCTDSPVAPTAQYADCSASLRITLLKGGSASDIVALSASQESGNECFELLSFDGQRWTSVGSTMLRGFGTVYKTDYGMKAGSEHDQPPVIINRKTKMEYRYTNGKFVAAS